MDGSVTWARGHCQNMSRRKDSLCLQGVNPRDSGITRLDSFHKERRISSYEFKALMEESQGKHHLEN